MEKTKNLAQKTLDQSKNPVTSLSWMQCNDLVKTLNEQNNKLEYLGEVLDSSNNLCCVFQSLIRNSNNTFKKGDIYIVNNDVVFEFQKTKKPIQTKIKLTAKEILDD